MRPEASPCDSEPRAFSAGPVLLAPGVYMLHPLSRSSVGKARIDEGAADRFGVILRDAAGANDVVPAPNLLARVTDDLLRLVLR